MNTADLGCGDGDEHTPEKDTVQETRANSSYDKLQGVAVRKRWISVAAAIDVITLVHCKCLQYTIEILDNMSFQTSFSTVCSHVS